MISLGSPRTSSIRMRPLPDGTGSSGVGIWERDLSFRFGPYEVDLVQQELRRAGSVVPVEPQVFDVLVHLLKHRDRIVSKDELFEVVWHGRIVSDAALNSRISAARRAIGDDGNTQALIRTAQKRGFRFVGDVQVEDGDAPAQADDLPQNDIVAQVGPTLAPLAVPAEPLPLPNKPSIAVLPFQNMSGDPEQDYFADGLTEDIITGLSQQQWFFVIARNSSFSYKGEAVDVRQVAGQLGVRYILEGSVRRSASRVRVTGQLIDATHGNHLWAERYDREIADIFELQDEITSRVIDSVSPQILLAEAARVRRKAPQSIKAWDLVMQALPYMWRMTTEDHSRAQDLLLEALTLDPEYAHAYALLGWTYISMFNLDTGKPIHEFTERALDAGTRAVELDDQDPWGQLVLGLAHARRRRPEPALMHLSKAVELNPNFALGHAGLGYGLAAGGQPERGLDVLEQAHRLSPRDPFLAIYAPTVRYMALFALGRYAETIDVCRATIALHPKHAGAWRLMTVSLALGGKIEEAKVALAQTLRLQPDLSLDHVENNTIYADPADRARFREGLRKAGLER
jgi:TolB-like protein/DNA-binding winged helix-turn-helix (wHTH) protein/cytochrome c-type biogenesis protein CcmH/NrfG